MKRELKRARLRRLMPWQRDLVRAFKNFTRSCGVAALHFRRFGKIARPLSVSSMDSDAADALRYALERGQPVKLTMP